MNEALTQTQAADYSPFIASSYAVAGIVLLWVVWRSVSLLRKEKRALKRVKPS